MLNLKTIFAAGASALILTGAIAAPATAQPNRNYERGYDNDRDYNDRGYNERGNRGDRYSHPSYGNNANLSTGHVDSLEWRINNAPISNGHRRALLNEWRQIQPLAHRVQTGQANRWEYNRLRTGVNRIEQATRNVSYDGDRRDSRYGNNDRRW